MASKELEVKEWLLSLRWSGGFDRNSSHTEGEYVEYINKLDDWLPSWMLEDLAEAIWQKYH